MTAPDRKHYVVRLRLEAGHTQEEAARLVHAHRVTWARWEDGTRKPDETALHLYCLLTGQTYDPPRD